MTLFPVPKDYESIQTSYIKAYSNNQEANKVLKKTYIEIEESLYTFCEILPGIYKTSNIYYLKVVLLKVLLYYKTMNKFK